MEHATITLNPCHFRPAICIMQLQTLLTLEAINHDTWSLLEGIKEVVDPKGLMNPGSLGLK